jgi:hypothetical protein
MVFELPSILSFTQEIIALHGMPERVTVRHGHYFQDDFAEGDDLVLLSNTLQTKGQDLPNAIGERLQGSDVAVVPRGRRASRRSHL